MAKKAPAQAVTPDVIDVAPENPELALITHEGSMVAGLLGNIRQFFATAQEIEKRATGTLASARALKPPTTAGEDLAVQNFIRAANVDRKSAEEHWTLTSKIHQFHRKLTAARDRSCKPLEEAAEIGNRLHNRYVEDEKRRAREEELRLQREADERARLDRERELARLEDEALRKEAASADLSERESLFVDAVVRGYPINVAARQAGYKNPDVTAQRLMSTAKIAAAIQAKRDAITLRQQAEAKRAMPLITDDVEVKPNIVQTGDRTTKAAELVDVDLFIATLLDPGARNRYGIPSEIAVDALRRAFKDGPTPLLNEQARSMGELIARWPGLRLKTTTKVL